MGALFSIDAAGGFTALGSLFGPDGSFVIGMTETGAGNFFGVAELGGAHSDGVVFELGGVISDLPALISPALLRPPFNTMLHFALL
jgi:hypothetical protein